MQGNSVGFRNDAGASAPKLGSLAPRCAAALALVVGLIGCGEDEETRTLPPVSVAMTDQMAAIYDDGELTLFEVKMPVAFPIKAPTAAQQGALNGSPMPPYPSKPWLTMKDVGVQITWTMTNLDAQTHNVHLLIDPWNEFGRYWPGLALVDADDAEFLPNLSGIDIFMELPGTESGRPSRRRGTFTFNDMEELAIDFATVMNIIEQAPPPDPLSDSDPTVTLVNHAFAIENKSYNSPLVKPFQPAVITGLTGVDVGLRTFAAANIALEVVVELVDRGSGRVIERDATDTPIPEPTNFITAGYGGGVAP